MDPSSKGLGPSEHPEEWFISVRLDRPTPPWFVAWEEQVYAMGDRLRDAEWEFDADDRRTI